MYKYNIPNNQRTQLCNMLRWLIFLFFPVTIGLVGCSKMDATYHNFWKDGKKVYPSSVDSINVFSGKNRIKMILIIPGSTSVTKAKIYWNNKTDSVKVPIQQDEKAGKDTIEVMLNNLPEGFYSFDIYTYDDKGNRSVVTNAIGHAYGDNYSSSLLSRLIKSAIYINNTVTIVWNDPADKTSIGAEILYKKTGGDSQRLFISPSEDTTFLADMVFNSGDVILSRTLYVPDSTSIDTFYTAYDTVKIMGSRVEYDRESWTALAEDYDVPSGRVPQNVLDGKTSSVWHMDKTHSYPHHITIDMHATNQVNGFYFIQRTPLNGAAKLIMIEVSSDNQNWESLSPFTLENNGDKQFIELPEAITFRYLKVTFKSDYKGGDFTAIAEIGAYKR